jgi:hypothetical protein
MLQSLISTTDPLTGSQKRAAAAVPQAFRGSANAGDASRDAYARGLADMSRNTLSTAIDQYRQQYQQRAEQARSNDLVYQRGIGQGQYELDRNRSQMIRQQDLALSRGQQQVQQSRDLARKQSEQQLTNDVLGAVFGSNNAYHAAPLIGNALAGGARPFAGISGWGGYGGGGGGGLLSLLMGAA